MSAHIRVGGAVRLVGCERGAPSAAVWQTAPGEGLYPIPREPTRNAAKTEHAEDELGVACRKLPLAISLGTQRVLPQSLPACQRSQLTKPGAPRAGSSAMRLHDVALSGTLAYVNIRSCRHRLLHLAAQRLTLDCVTEAVAWCREEARGAVPHTETTPSAPWSLRLWCSMCTRRSTW